MHLIEVRDVYKIYNPGENQVNALDGVSITIDEGDLLLLSVNPVRVNNPYEYAWPS